MDKRNKYLKNNAFFGVFFLNVSFGNRNETHLRQLELQQNNFATTEKLGQRGE